jgi:hypothetical protein
MVRDADRDPLVDPEPCVELGRAQQQREDDQSRDGDRNGQARRQVLGASDYSRPREGFAERLATTRRPPTE